MFTKYVRVSRTAVMRAFYQSTLSDRPAEGAGIFAMVTDVHQKVRETFWKRYLIFRGCSANLRSSISVKKTFLANHK